MLDIREVTLGSDHLRETTALTGGLRDMQIPVLICERARTQADVLHPLPNFKLISYAPTKERNLKSTDMSKQIVAYVDEVPVDYGD